MAPKNVTSAVCFEEELQVSFKEGGTTICDVFSSVWGPCQAIVPTFHRLYEGASANLKLKVLTVDADAILEELEGRGKGPPQRSFVRPIAYDEIKETLPTFWQPILTQCRERAKPLFLFWRAGRLMEQVDGVDTPAICAAVNRLFTIQIPARQWLINPSLCEFWVTCFHPVDPEVHWDIFMSAVAALCQWDEPVPEDVVGPLQEALRVEDDLIVHAQFLQQWVGPTGTLTEAAADLLYPCHPDDEFHRFHSA